MDKIENLGLLFNKRIYLKLKSNPEENVSYRIANMDLYQKLIETKLSDLNPEQLNLSKYFSKDQYYSFTLTTSGQGLLIGTGNEHGTGAEVIVNGEKIESHEFKMGFHFDHSTGIPVITGHSLKGRIRSFFPIAYEEDHKKDAIYDRIKDDIKDCLDKTWEKYNIDLFQNSVFEGKELNHTKQDVFLGAYPSKSNHPEFSYFVPKKITNNKPKYIEDRIFITKGTFLFDDTFAYHSHPLKDPNPIRFIKILPNVEIKFQFLLYDSGGLTKEDKKKLFEYLLKKYGAGAKTSSNYGQFKKTLEVNNNIMIYPKFENFNPIKLIKKEESDEISKTANKIEQKIIVKQKDDWVELNTLKVGSIVKGTSIDVNSGNVKVRLHIKDTTIVLNLQGKYKEGKVYDLIVKETSGKLEKGNYKITKVIEKK